MNKNVLRVAAAALIVALALVGVAAWGAPGVSAATGDATDSAYLGITIVTLNARTAKQLNLEQTEGVAIAAVVAGSPAEAAGLKKGDIVNTVNGVAVKTAQEAVAEVQKAKAGDVVTLGITRNGQAMSVAVTSAAAPERPARGVERLPKLSLPTTPRPVGPSELKPS